MTRRQRWNAVSAAGLDVAAVLQPPLDDTRDGGTGDGDISLSGTDGVSEPVKKVAAEEITSDETGFGDGESLATTSADSAAATAVTGEPAAAGNPVESEADHPPTNHPDASPEAGVLIPAASDIAVATSPPPPGPPLDTAHPTRSSSRRRSDTTTATNPPPPADHSDPQPVRRALPQARREAPSSQKYNFTVAADVFEQADDDRQTLGIPSWGEYFLQLLAWYAHDIDAIVDDQPFDLSSLGIGIVPRRGYQRRDRRPAVLSVYLPRGEVGAQIAELIEDLASRSRSKSAFAEQLLRHRLAHRPPDH